MKFFMGQGTEGCCGITEFLGFTWDRKDPMRAIYDNFEARNEPPQWPGIVIFSGNRLKLANRRAPHRFAEWLRRQGEQVLTTGWQRNSNYGDTKPTIKAYMWSPSRQFKGKFNEYVKKHKLKDLHKIKEEDGYGAYWNG